MSRKVWIVEHAVLPDCVMSDARIVTVDGRITSVEHDDGREEGERLRGTLLPGFVDLQVNGAGGRSVDEASPEALDTVREAVLRGGGVAFLPTLITAPWERLLEQVGRVARWIEETRSAGDLRRGAEPLGLHVEGPFLTTPGAHDPRHFVDPTPERIGQLVEAARGTLRLLTLACSRPGAAEATTRLREAGVAVSIGHCSEVEGFRQCVDAGAGTVTHLFNAMGRLHHRDPHVAGTALDESRVLCPMIVDGHHIHPTMLRLAFRILGPDRTVLVTDATAAAGMPDGDYTLSGMAVRSERGIVRDRDGHLAGSALTMALAARHFLEFVPEAGPWTLARVAAANPARLLEAEDYGEIAPGRRAAFTLREPDGSFRCLTA